MENHLENAPVVRLKYFLARQIEKRGKQAENVTEQQAAVLTALMLTEQYANTLLNQKKLCRLLGVKDTRMTLVIGELESQGFILEDKTISQRGNWYRVTEEGHRAAVQFAEDILGIPIETEEKLSKRSDYASLLGVSDEYIDEFLRKQFLAAKTV
jgi:DNA-binding MarR family transcriptional regulator